MADVQTLSELDQAIVQSNLALLQAMLQDAYPSMDLSSNTVFVQQVLRPAALFHTIRQTDMARLRQSNSLAAIAANPGLATDALVDNVASNYNIVRKGGNVASGLVTLVVQTNNLLVVANSITFTSGGVTFQPDANYAGVADVSLVTDPDVDLVFNARSDGTYSITFRLVSTSTGSSGNLAVGSSFTLSPSLAGVITAVAAGDFNEGSSTESTASLIARLPNGLAQKSAASRSGLRGLLQEQFPAITDVSIIGAGDAEMLRDSHTTLAVKSGGKADVYVRTSVKPIVTTVIVTATLQNVLASTWAVNFGRDSYSGLYGADLLPLNAVQGFGRLPVVSLTRGQDLSLPGDLDWTPAIANAAEAYFSRYQTLTIRFTDTTINPTALGLAVGSTRSYQAIVTYLPNIDVISDWLTQRSNRHVGGDYLVKAPLPCFVSVGARILQGRGDTVLTADSLQTVKTAIADAINAVDFAQGRLDASVILDAVQPLLPGRSRLQLPLNLRGQILLPDGSENWVFDGNGLQAPNRPDVMCSPRTVAFFGDPGRITLDAVITSTPPV